MFPLIQYFVFLYGAYIACNVVSQTEYDMSKFTDGMSEDLLFSLNDTKGFRPSSVEEIRNSAKKILSFNFGLRRRYRLHYGNNADYVRGCYAIGTTNRAAISDLRNYFQLRVLYSNTLEYEVGYLTHEIIYRYQMILEMYKLVEFKLIGKESQTHAPNMYVFYMYTNILEQTKVIIHLCNMMQELEKKYKMSRQKGVFDNDEIYESRTPKPSNMSEADAQKQAYDEYIKRWQRERKRKRKEQRQREKHWAKFVPYNRTQKTTPKRSSWPLQYGWSIEDW